MLMNEISRSTDTMLRPSDRQRTDRPTVWCRLARMTDEATVASPSAVSSVRSSRSCRWSRCGHTGHWPEVTTSRDAATST